MFSLPPFTLCICFHFLSGSPACCYPFHSLYYSLQFLDRQGDGLRRLSRLRGSLRYRSLVPGKSTLLQLFPTPSLSALYFQHSVHKTYQLLTSPYTSFIQAVAGVSLVSKTFSLRLGLPYCFVPDRWESKNTRKGAHGPTVLKTLDILHCIPLTQSVEYILKTVLPGQATHSS